MEHEFDLLGPLYSIDPALLNYSEWCQVGMALKAEGYTADDWDKWSQQDPYRYHPHECEYKWDTFSSSGITGATITMMAKQQGWSSGITGHAIDWDDEISFDAVPQIATGYHTQTLIEPQRWDNKADLIKYINTLFDPDDNVSYTLQCYQDEDGKWKPSTAYNHKASRLLADLSKYDDIELALGTYNMAAGAWICFNPIDGERKNENVTDYRYALVESDTMDIDAQYGLIKELNLPCAAVVNSGGKSVHAIVRVNAPNYEEYKKRVEYLYSVLQKNGMEVDTQNKNPARLSRMPGVYRDSRKQYLIATDIGCADWQAWIDYMAEIDDEYPAIEAFTEDVFDNPPEMPPVAIDGLAYRGNLILISGQSKAGKTSGLLEMCAAFAEGGYWFGHRCTQGKVLYINFEVDKAPCVHRIIDVYKALNLKPEHGFDCWHLRGTAVTMEKFVPKMLRRIKERNYDVIVIDPLYKLNDGDENSAGDMSRLFNQLDKIASMVGATVVISHHYSKGAQSGKNAIDRASGSGVFARAPDLIITMDELALTDDMISKAGEQGLDTEKIIHNGAWRSEFTPRYFMAPLPVNMFFIYPIHVIDEWGILDNADYADMKTTQPRKSAEELAEEKFLAFDIAFEEAVNTAGEADISRMCENLKLTQSTFRNRLSEYNKAGRERKYENIRGKGKIRISP